MYYNMNFICVYCRTRKKIDKYFKVNKIKNKYVLDVRKMMDEEGLSVNDDLTYLKILIYNKIQKAIENNKDIFYIPNFDTKFNIEKLFNIRSILGDNAFNVLIFYDEFSKFPHLIDDAYSNLDKFDNSQIIRDY